MAIVAIFAAMSLMLGFCWILSVAWTGIVDYREDWLGEACGATCCIAAMLVFLLLQLGSVLN